MIPRILLPGRTSALSSLNRLLRNNRHQGAKYFILLDENTYNQCLPLLISHVSALEEAELLEVPVGEEAKTIETATQLWGALLDSHADRNAVILNLGGGCVSDLGGFVAAGYKRGIRFVNVPTTLVAMVDAAIGGKTAVNLEGVKNQVGFFYQPDAICIEPAFLDTLPSAELSLGLWEMLKTFALANPLKYHTLCRQMATGNVALTDEMIKECVNIKSSIVRQDPTEHGIRKMLNFGHTFGHAIEAYSHLPHGTAVGLGMWCAFYLSYRKMGLDKEILDAYTETLKSSVSVPRYSLKDTEPILQYMQQDKKNSDGLILCVLLQQIGVPVIDVPVDENEIRDTLLSLGKL